MTTSENLEEFFRRYAVAGNHAKSNYFTLVKKIIHEGKNGEASYRKSLNRAYDLIRDEIVTNSNKPQQVITFGTSGWRGQLGKDIYARSVAAVTTAIVQIYEKIDTEKGLAALLGVESFAGAKQRGCVLGFDNRFAGSLLASHVAAVLLDAGFVVHYAGESTTGVLSAAVLEKKAAFSINLTPSHNPLEYGGYKFNAADGGPAEPAITSQITINARALIAAGFKNDFDEQISEDIFNHSNVKRFDSLSAWRNIVHKNYTVHGLSLDTAAAEFRKRDDILMVVDCVHGASRLHIQKLFDPEAKAKLIVLRGDSDVTFGGVSPEPSSENMQRVVELLQQRKEKFGIGAIIDPDGDRIRFTDGNIEISMNQFGAMAYHFLHEHKGKKGMVAKTVATSNLANSLSNAFGEDLFEPAVGFKNFKPVMGKALVCFEESDGITVIGHTPEKDAYIGLLTALEMVLSTDMNLGDYLLKIENKFGDFYPHRDGIKVQIQGDSLLHMLEELSKYTVGSQVNVGQHTRTIQKLITIDGIKMVFDDGSWLMIRPSGTEPKVRFYVESRTPEGTQDLVVAAKAMLVEIGLDV